MLFSIKPTTQTMSLNILLFCFLATELSIYSKLLATATCDYCEDQADETCSGDFYPEYPGSRKYPYAGKKLDKLTKLANMFCRQCDREDNICKTLFCEPDLMIITFGMGLIKIMCVDLEKEAPKCHKEYCNQMSQKFREKRGLNIINNNASKFVTCVPIGIWQNVSGMMEWCANNCGSGWYDTCRDVCACPDNVPSDSSSTSSTSTVSLTTKSPITAASPTVASTDTATSSATISMTSSTTNNAITTTSVDTTTTGITSTTNITTPFAGADTTSLHVVNSLLCKQALDNGQVSMSHKYCDTTINEDMGRIEHLRVQDVEQVLTFAPSLFCSLVKEIESSDICPNMFCGPESRMATLVKQTICAVCLAFSFAAEDAESCIQSYC